MTQRMSVASAVNAGRVSSPLSIGKGHHIQFHWHDVGFVAGCETRLHRRGSAAEEEVQVVRRFGDSRVESKLGTNGKPLERSGSGVLMTWKWSLRCTKEVSVAS
jgi:hypothetical protein